MNDEFLVLYSDRDSGKFGNIGVFSPDEFRAACSPEGFTISFGNPVDLECRERGFINDSSFSKENISRALCNYFMHGRFNRELFNDSQVNIPSYIEKMEGWILDYLEYLQDPELKEVISYAKEIYDTYGI